jgi:restriction system protein
MSTMKQQTNQLQAHATAPHDGKFGVALPLTAGLLCVLWVCAWWFDYNLTVTLAVSLVSLVVGLMAHGIAVALASRKPEQVRVQPSSSWATDRHAGAQRSGDELGETRFSAQLNGKRWTLDVFEAIDAQRFAAVCETWFAWAGFDTRSEAHRTDEGVDIWLHAAKMPGPVAIVRCKHWLNKPVGLQDMKDFVNVMSSLKSVHGTYTTTSTYTPEALQLAKENGIDAVDGRGLLRRIQTRTRQRQQALLAVAFNGQP